jgi:hypothetical protein
MGWWKIDPATGEALQDSASALSRPPDFVLLNALPGVDDEAGSHYLGDTNYDFAMSLAGELRPLFDGRAAPAPDELRDLLLYGIAPSEWPVPLVEQAFARNDALWADLDSVYQEDWQRAATDAEKRWTAEHVVRSFAQAVAPPVVSPAIEYGPLQSEFALGDRVWAWWNSPQLDYYVGTVVKAGGIAHDATGQIELTVDYVVRFDDGDQAYVPPERVFRLTLPPGLAVEVRAPNENRYFPGTILSVSPQAIAVRMPDGRVIQTGTALLRVPGKRTTR